MKGFLRFLPLVLVSLAFWSTPRLTAQDWVHTGTNLSNPTVRIAAADFKPVGGDPQTPALKAVFDATLYNDLGNAGIFDLVSKSMAPQAMPGSPQEIVLSQWSAAPASASMVAFGALSVTQRAAGGVRLAVRRAQHARIRRCWASSTTKRRARTWRARWRTGSRMRSSTGWAAGIERDRGDQDLLCEHAQRVKRDLGDGLRRAKSASDHTPGQHFALSAHLTR